MKITFTVWMADVNRYLDAQYGLYAEDLPDCNYVDWWEDGVTAVAAAKRAVGIVGLES